MKLSSYQNAIAQNVSNSKSNLCINAKAGTGKTSTIVHLAKNVISNDKKVLFLAFNKSIVEELKVKITATNVDIKTLHGLGAQSLGKSYKYILQSDKYKVELNQYLYSKYFVEDNIDPENEGQFKANILKLCDLGRANLVTSVDQLYDIADYYEIELFSNECRIAFNLIQWGLSAIREVLSNNRAKISIVIDFTDMIYFPNVVPCSIEQYDIVFIDEAQDLNEAQRNLMLKAVKPNGKFIAVGDPNQSIYGFCGASTDSFQQLVNLPNTVELPLSICYRCDKEIIALAQTIVPEIEAREDAKNGIVDNNAKLAEIKDNDLVLCRLTYPLVALCMQYIGNGIKAYVKGKDIGTNLINMINRTKARKMDLVMQKLGNELNKVANKVMTKTKCTYSEATESTQFRAFSDKIRAIEVLSNGLDYADAVCRRIDSIFKDDQKNGICLSTIHKAKGLESNNCYIICPEKLYNKRAMKIAWMAQQETNLAYVAFTRAKHKLGFITDFNPDNEE